MSVNSFLNNFLDRVVLVTGAASGIGRAVAVAFAERGSKVIVADVNIPGAEDTIIMMNEHGGAPDKCLFVETDVSDAASVQHLFREIEKKYGRLDFAVNCAAVEGERALLHESDVSNFEGVFDTNCKGLFLSLKHEITLMLKSIERNHDNPALSVDARGIDIIPENLQAMSVDFQPAIVNISSTAGLNPTPEFSPYGASKHAQLGLTKTAAIEYAGKIRINAIAPATTYTPMYERFAVRWPDWQASTNANYALGRIATPEEIARAAVWLCSRECNFLIGHVVSIDGGQGFPAAQVRPPVNVSRGWKLMPQNSCQAARVKPWTTVTSPNSNFRRPSLFHGVPLKAHKKVVQVAGGMHRLKGAVLRQI